jgi:hypothetical protein
MSAVLTDPTGAARRQFLLPLAGMFFVVLGVLQADSNGLLFVVFVRRRGRPRD